MSESEGVTGATAPQEPENHVTDDEVAKDKVADEAEDRVANDLVPENEQIEKEASPEPEPVTEAAEIDETNIKPQDEDSTNKVVIITGANSGIGLIAAEKLAQDGYEVIMACRSEAKAKDAVSKVQNKVPSAKVSFMKLDLNSLKSVREFSDAFHATGKPLNVLCNNAGLTTGFSSKQRLETEDGFEMTFGVNHLGHFLLTNLLLDVIKKTADACGEARIIITSSSLHDPETQGGKRGAPAHLDFDDLMMTNSKPFDGMLAYKNSKLANCVFSNELAKRLQGSKVTSNTLCPGFIPATDLQRNETTFAKIRMTIFTPLLKLIGVTRTVEHGGGMIHYLATSSDWKDVTGKHSSDYKMIDSSKESRDPDVCKKLWDVSADLVSCEAAKAL